MAHMLSSALSFNYRGLVCSTHHIQQDVFGAARQNKHAYCHSSRDGVRVCQHTCL